MLRATLLGAAAALLLAAPAAHANHVQQAEFVVSSAGNEADETPGNGVCKIAGSNACTLRAAIGEGNAHANGAFPDDIHFAIGAAGTATTIAVPAALPTITERLLIDGTTQPGYAGVPLITLDGAGSEAGMPDGLTVATTAAASHIEGLAILDFNTGLELEGGATVERNYIGIARDGTVTGATENFIGIHTSATGPSSIGDDPDLEPTAFNVISGNTVGLELHDSGQVYGNRIGTDPTGTQARGNEIGIRAVEQFPAIIENVISGNVRGVELESGGFLQRNHIGADLAGTDPLGNAEVGVRVENEIDNFDGNVIAASGEEGVEFVDGSAGSTMRDNRVGLGIDGSAMGNLRGVGLSTGGITIGGPLAGDPNTIAYNTEVGIRVVGGTGSTFARNAFRDNVGLAIDLGADGADFIDPDDDDTGPNLHQNYPVVAGAVSGQSVTGTLDSTEDRTYTIDVFASPACDPTTFGEGATRLGSTQAQTNGDGDASWSFPLPSSVAAGQQITAIATDPDGNSSEFSKCRAVTAPATVTTQPGEQPKDTTIVDPPITVLPKDPPPTVVANREPDSDIKRVRARRPGALKRFSGTATDADGNLARVEIALYASKGRRCLRLRSNGRLRSVRRPARGCRPAAFLRAQGTSAWRFRLKRRLPRGSYVLVSRAVDAGGLREKTFSAADRNRVAFRLR